MEVTKMELQQTLQEPNGTLTLFPLAQLPGPKLLVQKCTNIMFYVFIEKSG